MRAHWLQHAPFEGLGSIDGWLRAAGARVTTTRLFEPNAALPPPDEIDLLIAMGGPMSVNDDATLPWLADERQYVRDAIERGTAVVGICLGAQLIASAMGARVYPNHEREIGWWPIEGTGSREGWPIWAVDGQRREVFHWHGETFDLPSGAVHLARSAGCEQQAFALGDRVIGLQCHLEMTDDGVRDLVAHCGHELTPAPFVQSAAAILAHRAGAEPHALMAATLDGVTRRPARSGARDPLRSSHPA